MNEISYIFLYILYIAWSIEFLDIPNSCIIFLRELPLRSNLTIFTSFLVNFVKSIFFPYSGTPIINSFLPTSTSLSNNSTSGQGSLQYL